ncbi:MAG: beta-lactamase family protein, partial [Actinomycetota bacterium]|nr:beta-lactamase family protein [Actinomycetota bacterium]
MSTPPLAERGPGAPVAGACDERFIGVQHALAALLEGVDIGASVAVYLDGEPVVDLWGGFADQTGTTLWERDTITCTFSVTKTMTSLCALVLADRGDFDLHKPVAHYWPEFAAAGKEAIEVRHLLGHTAGLARWAGPMNIEDVYDWGSSTARLAAQAPQWEPGTVSGYHALTFGHLVGEVVRRVSGRSLGAFFAEEIAGPLHADFHIGLAAKHDSRVSLAIADPDRAMADLENQLLAQIWGDPAYDVDTAATLKWRRAEVPAGNGFGNARSVAAIQSVLACGGEARGVRLLSEQGCNAVFEEQAHGTDRCLGVPLRLGMGYGLPSTT